MPKAVAPSERKSKAVNIRLTESEYLGLEYLAKQNRITVAETARELLFSGMELLQQGDAQDIATVQQSEHTSAELIERIAKQLEPLSSLSERDTDMGRQLRKLQRSIDALAYSHMFHAAPIADDYKGEAERYANETYKKYDNLRGAHYGALPNARPDSGTDT